MFFLWVGAVNSRLRLALSPPPRMSHVRGATRRYSRRRMAERFVAKVADRVRHTEREEGRLEASAAALSGARELLAGVIFVPGKLGKDLVAAVKAEAARLSSSQRTALAYPISVAKSVMSRLLRASLLGSHRVLTNVGAILRALVPGLGAVTFAAVTAQLITAWLKGVHYVSTPGVLGAREAAVGDALAAGQTAVSPLLYAPLFAMVAQSLAARAKEILQDNWSSHDWTFCESEFLRYKAVLDSNEQQLRVLGIKFTATPSTLGATGSFSVLDDAELAELANVGMPVTPTEAAQHKRVFDAWLRDGTVRPLYNSVKVVPDTPECRRREALMSGAAATGGRAVGGKTGRARGRKQRSRRRRRSRSAGQGAAAAAAAAAAPAPAPLPVWRVTPAPVRTTTGVRAFFRAMDREEDLRAQGAKTGAPPELVTGMFINTKKLPEDVVAAIGRETSRLSKAPRFALAYPLTLAARMVRKGVPWLFRNVLRVVLHFVGAFYRSLQIGLSILSVVDMYQGRYSYSDAFKGVTAFWLMGLLAQGLQHFATMLGPQEWAKATRTVCKADFTRMKESLESHRQQLHMMGLKFTATATWTPLVGVGGTFTVLDAAELRKLADMGVHVTATDAAKRKQVFDAWLEKGIVQPVHCYVTVLPDEDKLCAGLGRR
jgi:hypothetical protein